MKTFFERTTTEHEIIRKAFVFEIEAIKKNSWDENPYGDAVRAMGLWEAINEAVELYYGT